MSKIDWKRSDLLHPDMERHLAYLGGIKSGAVVGKVTHAHREDGKASWWSVCLLPGAGTVDNGRYHETLDDAKILIEDLVSRWLIQAKLA